MQKRATRISESMHEARAFAEKYATEADKGTARVTCFGWQLEDIDDA